MTTTPEFGADEAVGTDRKRVLIAAGVAAALALGGGGYLLLSGGGEETPLGPVPHAAPKAVAKPAVKKAPAKKRTTVPTVSTVKLGRDPFIALYTVPVDAPAGPSTTDTGTGTGTGTTTDGTSGTDSGTATEPYSLTLQGITGSTTKLYAFNVGGTKKTVVESQRFGKYGELVVLSTIRNTKGSIVGALIQVGDDDPVTIDLGEKLTVL